MCAGVSLTIPPLLSLGADQTEKIRKNASQNGGPVHSFHLDELRCPQAQRLLSERILSLLVDTHTTIFIFSSPQEALVNNKVWRTMIDSLIAKRLLSMLCVSTSSFNSDSPFDKNLGNYNPFFSRSSK
jgi:hypothetical protein